MSKHKTTIYVKTTFTGFHQWPAAPDNVAFLRNLHRHVFHVEYHLEVNHGDREVEFFTFKRDLDYIIQKQLLPKLELMPSMSCEMLANALREFVEIFTPKSDQVEMFPQLSPYNGLSRKIIVSEDGENGAILEISAPN